MNFGHKNLPGKFPIMFIGTGIGMPVYSGNKIFENSNHSKFDTQWINITEITMARNGSCPCIQ